MTLAFIAVIFGLALLVWSADRFVEGSASTARHFGMPPLLIGMVIVGFGTSAPEMVVSALAASQGNPGIALVREKILKGVWGENYFGDVKIVDVNIRRLRMKVEDEPSHPTHIMTVWGYGYRWEE